MRSLKGHSMAKNALKRILRTVMCRKSPGDHFSKMVQNGHFGPKWPLFGPFWACLGLFSGTPQASKPPQIAQTHSLPLQNHVCKLLSHTTLPITTLQNHQNRIFHFLSLLQSKMGKMCKIYCLRLCP